MDERAIELNNEDAWGVLTCLGYSEAVVERLRAVELDSAAADLHYPLRALLRKLWRAVQRPDRHQVRFTLAELHTIALSVPPTAWHGARGFLQAVYRACLELSGEEVESDGKPPGEDTG